MLLSKFYHGDALFPAVLRTLDEKPVKVKLGALEFMYHLTPDADNYLTYPLHMRQVRVVVVVVDVRFSTAAQ